MFNRFFELFDLNLSSIKNANIKDAGATKDYQPHYVSLSYDDMVIISFSYQITRRYAEFTASMLRLSMISEDMEDITFVKTLNQNLSKLREEMEKFLIRLADAKHNDWKSKTIFLINNYDIIVSVIAVYIITLKLVCKISIYLNRKEKCNRWIAFNFRSYWI